MRLFFISFLLVTTISALGYFMWYRPKFKAPAGSSKSPAKRHDGAATLARLKQKAGLVLPYIRSGNFNEQYCFLVDMRIASGKQRFFVYNLRKDSVEQAGLVAHGSGSDKGGDELYFSNAPNSNCTSLGKYRIGKSYYGSFGLAYKLYGLDASNNNAFNRFVVLHAHSCVPVGEIYPVPLCESWGCPTVAPAFLQELKKYIDRSDEPVLMCIYY